MFRKRTWGMGLTAVQPCWKFVPGISASLLMSTSHLVSSVRATRWYLCDSSPLCCCCLIIYVFFCYFLSVFSVQKVVIKPQCEEQHMEGRLLKFYHKALLAGMDECRIWCHYFPLTKTNFVSFLLLLPISILPLFIPYLYTSLHSSFYFLFCCLLSLCYSFFPFSSFLVSSFSPLLL